MALTFLVNYEMERQSDVLPRGHVFPDAGR
jgi:hypothetical protein